VKTLLKNVKKKYSRTLLKGKTCSVIRIKLLNLTLASKRLMDSIGENFALSQNLTYSHNI